MTMRFTEKLEILTQQPMEAFCVSLLMIDPAGFAMRNRGEAAPCPTLPVVPE